MAFRKCPWWRSRGAPPLAAGRGASPIQKLSGVDRKTVRVEGLLLDVVTDPEAALSSMADAPERGRRGRGGRGEFLLLLSADSEHEERPSKCTFSGVGGGMRARSPRLARRIDVGEADLLLSAV